MSYGDLMDDLNSAWRKVDAPEEPATNDNGWVHTNVGVFEELEALGLSNRFRNPNRKNVVGKRRNQWRVNRKDQEVGQERTR